MATPNPLQAAFWDEEFWRMLEEVSPEFLLILFAGAKAGALALPAGMSVLIDWAWFNQAAIDWLTTWQGGILTGIHNTTRIRTAKIITEWIRSGERLPLLIKRLEWLYGDDRAEMIGVTEVTRAYAEGNLLAWRAAGSAVTGKRWMTAMDERVCPICGPLQGVEIGIDSAWTMTPGGKPVYQGNGKWTIEGGAIVEDKSGLGLLAPPAHIRCRCWLQPVVTEDGLRQALRRALAGYERPNYASTN